jgi:hypothetical protein
MNVADTNAYTKQISALPTTLLLPLKGDILPFQAP